MANIAEVFARFLDVKKNDDGSRTVYGLVTGEAVDADDQIADADWARKQMDGWAKWSNIRAMHKADAVGVGVSMEENDNGIFLEGKIVDADAVMKIDEGVYKGYSIGIKSLPGNPYKVVKDASAKNGRIVGGAIVEVSIVDRPAHPEASFSVVKNIEALDKEASDVAILTQAAELIKSVIATQVVDSDPPVQDGTEKTASKGYVSVGVDVRTSSYSSGDSYEEALGSVLSALGLKAPMAEVTKGVTCSDCGAALETGESCKACASKAVSPSTGSSTPDPEEDEVVDKVQLAEIIKGMTVEERAEVGLITQEDLVALKTGLDEVKSEIAELGKAVQPTGLHFGSALSTGPKSTELSELEAEKAIYEDLVENMSSSSNAGFAQAKLVEINKAIAAATPAA